MPSSKASSTSCSTPNNDSLESVLHNDSVRYIRKGYGLITASIIMCSYFYFVPMLAKRYWKQLRVFDDDRYLYIVSVIFLHSGLMIIANLGLWLVYHLKLPFFERYKILNGPWPWEENPQKWRQTLRRTLKNLAITHMLVFPVILTADTFGNYPGYRTDLESFPSYLEILKHVLFCMLCEDFSFYWLHRLLHHRSIYAYIHKIHHEYSNSISIAAEYAHPIEYILSNMIPSSIGPKLLGSRIHMITNWMWLTIRILETVDGHCGYEFSWSPYRLLPLSGSSAYHNYHHSVNIGNYGSFFTIWDTLMRTNKTYYRHLAKNQQKEDLHRIKQEYLKKQKKLRSIGHVDDQVAPNELDELDEISELQKVE